MLDHWFSEPQATIAQAQALYSGGLYEMAAIFETPQGFVMGRIQPQYWPPDETARRVEELTGFRMVSCRDPILGIWCEYPVKTSVS